MTIELKEGLSRTDDLRAALQADGYVQGGKGPSNEAAGIDAQVCSEATCPNCGYAGLAYEPWINEAIYAARQGGYRALAVCPNCPHGQEF